MSRKNIYLNNPNLPTIDAQFEYDAEKVTELQKCKENVLYFAEKYFYIVNVDDGKQPITLHTYQKKALRMMRDNRFSLLLFSRQTGKSTISTIFCLWTACFFDSQNILVVANKESTAKEIFKRIRLAYEELPNWLKPGVKEYVKESMELANGSRIGIATTTSTAGRGTAANLLFVDEADWIEPNLLNEFWASVYPIISSSTKSKIIMASTPRDTSGLFYKLYSGSLKNENNWNSMKITWDEVPGRTERWKRETISSLGDPDVFKREFECEFDDVGESIIASSYFEKLKARCSDAPFIYMDGRYKMWETPQADHLYAVGVDISEGVGKDYTVAQILDITDLRQITQVAQYSNNTITPSEFTSKLNEILQHWGNPVVLIERNNCGAQVVDNLRKDFLYENIVSYGARELGRTKVPLGIISHSNTKYDCISNQRYWINTLEAVQINDILTIEELRDFVRMPNGSWRAKSGKHDDKVMALSWCLMILSDKIVSRYFEVLAVDENNKPMKLRPFDYGVGGHTSPSSMYSNEKYGDISALPTLFGASQVDDDIAELRSQGWEYL